ncbi:MAG TPA: 23S rRNA (adenine(1618)-N(6))-methyltransferase RlmF [Opitutaceae bacterium]|nr:23S rRNA (adenine(1618)-N(6))-methyltransferase RlmF [Opitutaceae bacterium]
MQKIGLHPRNRHRAGYDFPALVRASPELARFVRPSPVGTDTIDFADPAAVLALNRALLTHAYGISHWEIPAGYLCPPIPSRADYIHRVADLLAGAGDATPRGPATAVLDIGVGANCIYPIVGVAEYDWRFVGSDIDPVAVASARRIVAANSTLVDRVEIRHQRTPAEIFAGVVKPGETFAASICNPPFHASARDAAAVATRKLKNLRRGKTRSRILNFGGQSNELWCRGGEAAFIRRLIEESARQPELCRWFTTLVAQHDHLAGIYRALAAVRAVDVRTIPLEHGQKKSRIVAWTFQPARPTRPAN